MNGNDADLVVGWPNAAKEQRGGSPSYHKPPHCRRRVTFDCMTEVRLIELVDDMSEGEVAAMWYKEKEYKKIQKHAKAIIEYKTLLEKRADTATGSQLRLGLKLCDRGLEHMISKGASARRRAVKDSVIEAVLSEQKRWRDDRATGIRRTEGRGSASAADAICMVSTMASKSARDLATRMGKQDEDAAAPCRLEREVQALMPKSESIPCQREVPLRDLPCSAKDTQSQLQNALSLINIEEIHQDLASRAQSSAHQNQSDVLLKFTSDSQFSQSRVSTKSRSKSASILSKVSSLLNEYDPKSSKPNPPGKTLSERKKSSYVMGQALFGRFSQDNPTVSG